MHWNARDSLGKKRPIGGGIRCQDLLLDLLVSFADKEGPQSDMEKGPCWLTPDCRLKTWHHVERDVEIISLLGHISGMDNVGLCQVSAIFLNTFIQ